MTAPLLQVEDLKVDFSTRNGIVRALHGIGFTLHAGETLGIVGESGSGKSVTSLAVMRLLDRAGRIAGGRVLFQGRDITRAAPGDLRSLRGAAMSMIFQNPRAALNPIRTVAQQIMDVLRAHRRIDAAEARQQALDLLKAVRIRDPERRMSAYPNELSGGMCQRVMIAMAIACEPALLIADEPTTGLDVTTQKVVMDLLAGLTADRDMAVILITHDLGLAARYCGAIAVMEQGRIVEQGPTETLFRAAQHPYTRRLIAASPTRRSTLADLAQGAPPPEPVVRPPPPPGTGPLLDVQNLVKLYSGTRAVDDVSFTIAAGGSLGLVGESGSGKTTLSRMICRLIDADGGDVVFQGESIGHIPARDFHKAPQRRDVQIVFQDPTDSLNPRFTAFDSIAHPLRR
ncbi:MAG: ABC transporter ATP-binding protein, partial [Rhodospirillales bacterium]|nr:ABC transporter ATP-binding protein [Rhodospirillales bacterium]